MSRRPRSRRRRRRGGGEPALVRLLLRFCDRFRRLYEMRGVDYPAFRELLRVKLLLDSRRLGNKDGGLGFTKNIGFLGMLALYAGFSFLGGLFVFFTSGPFVFGTALLGFAMLMLALPLLVDFSAILLDTSDVSVLAPLPVDNATVLAARTTHVGLYLALILASLVPGPLLLGALEYPPLRHWVGYAICAVLTAMFTYSAVVLLYLSALRKLDLSRFKDAMVYVQTGAVVFFYLGFQIAPRLFARAAETGWLQRNDWIWYLLPSAWFGELYRLIVGRADSISPQHAALPVLAIAVPILSMLLVAVLARRGFLDRLVSLAESRGRSRSTAQRNGITGRLAARLTRPGLERAGYCFFLGVSRGDRGFKLRTMPLFVLILFPVLIPLISDFEDMTYEQLRLVLPYLLYAPVLLVPTVLMAARFGEDFEARWCFEALDDDELETFMRGTMKAVGVRFVFVPLVGLGALCVLVGGVGTVGTAALSAGLALLVSASITPRLGAILPFTEKYSFAASQSGTGMLMGATFGLGLLVVMQIAIGLMPFAHAVAAAVLLPLGVRAWLQIDRKKLRFVQAHVNFR